MKTICFDLDGTLCTNTNGDYENALPIQKRIDVVNKLFTDGYKIIIDTARGSTTGIDWSKVTEKQLNEWGVQYNYLQVGVKLHADVFVDDKGINDELFFNSNDIEESLSSFIRKNDNI